MRFCDICHNLTTFKVTESGPAWVCSACALEVPDDRPTVLLSTRAIGNRDSRRLHTKTSNLKHDPTLPRTRRYCSSCAKEEVFVFIEADRDKLLFQYICEQCGENQFNK